MVADGSNALTAEQMLASVIEMSTVALGVLDVDGTFLLSTSYPQLIGVNAFTAFAAHPATLGHLRRVLGGDETEWIDERDGRSYQVKARPIRDDEGELHGAVLVGTLIDAQVALSRRLVESEARLRQVVDSNMVGILFYADGTVYEANEAFARLLGYDAADIAAGTLEWAAINPPGFEVQDARAREEIAERGICSPYEKEMLHRDGHRVPVLVGGARFDRSRSAGVAFVLDISDAKRRERERDELQAKLLHVQKLESLGVLAGGIAHDFNNLLTAILGGAATALLSLAPESPARADIDVVLGAARRAADLTRQLLAYSGKGHFQVKPLDLSRTVKELAVLLETTISKRVQLRLELAPDLPAIAADSSQLQQIVMNLVLNAAEATGDAVGTVMVATGLQDVDAPYAALNFGTEALAPGRYVFLEVHDTGVGMEPHTLAQIFDPFFTTKFTGRGLGLAAVQGIVRAHHGAIRVYSELGRGSTFRVLFPATAEPAVVPAPARAGYRGAGLVLVIDDDTAVRTTLRRMLTHFGFSVLEADNGQEGVAVFRNRAAEIVLVVLDMTMPVMGGEAAFRELRAVRADIPVLLSSGHNEIEATRRVTARGSTAFLQKPFTPSDLVAKLEVILPRPA
jgi:two-component system cell cycle sensor histidine kinase/response regulator CckA